MNPYSLPGPESLPPPNIKQVRDGAGARLSTARKILRALGKSFADLNDAG